MDKYCKPSDVKISTMTVISNISPKIIDIELDVFSRFIPVYNQSSKLIEEREGCIVGIDHSSTDSRGIIQNKLKKNDFFNQTTIIYEYFGFRKVNIKLFNNGKLQMTGIQSFRESELMTKYIINSLKKMKIKVYNNVSKLPIYKSELDINQDLCNETYAIVYNPKNDKTSYYRRNYIKSIINFQNIDSLRMLSEDLGIDVNSDLFNYKDLECYINTDIWISDSQISKFSDIFNSKIENFNLILEQNIQEIRNKKNESVFTSLILECNNIKKFINKIELQDISVMNKIVKKYKDDLNYATNNDKIDNGNGSTNSDEVGNGNGDGSINSDEVSDGDGDGDGYWEFDFIENTEELKPCNLKIELINSDFITHFSINNTKLHELLMSKLKIFSSYEPNDYPGVKVKYFWNSERTTYKQGKCICNPLCVTQGKNTRCIQITISIFQSGSVIITGAKSIQQIRDAFIFINKIFETQFSKIQSKTKERNNVENQNNTYRKLMRKKRLFHIEKTNIINLPKELKE
jgi:TATA-box binding protein (TBP) (component of TFIID and TFIIIB)